MKIDKTAAAFFGPHGPDWSVRQGMLGPADKITDIGTSHWLIVPGPPMSAYVMHQAIDPDPKRWGFYHRHPDVWSIHTIISGHGFQYEEGEGFDIGPGDTIYHGPNIRHSIGPKPGSHLTMLVVQYPHIGYKGGQWQPCPEAGTVDDFMNPAAFHARFGPSPSLTDLLGNVLHMSDRWRSLLD
jgi:mannose-6-phosphate isomerase-like protein (cupin superfamily)